MQITLTLFRSMQMRKVSYRCKDTDRLISEIQGLIPKECFISVEQPVFVYDGVAVKGAMKLVKLQAENQNDAIMLRRIIEKHLKAFDRNYQYGFQFER